jgi:hypothetical protein
VPTVTLDQARAWIRGTKPLPGTDRRVFLTEVPDRELPRSMPAMPLLPASNRPGVTHDRTANGGGGASLSVAKATRSEATDIR